MTSPAPTPADLSVVFMDLETGGLDPDRHAIIQFAALATVGLREIVDEFEVKIHFPWSAVDEEALELNSYDGNTWAAEAKSPNVAADMIYSFLSNHAELEKTSRRGSTYKVARLAGHNAASFDCPFLAAWFKRRDKFCPAAIYEPLDTIQLARWYFAIHGDPPENLKLGTLAAHFGIEQPTHDALADVRTTADLAFELVRLLGGPE